MLGDGKTLPNVSPDLVLIGRSSSHFTRVARLFAHELGVEYSFEVVRDLRVDDARAYGGNPALKVPVLRAGEEAWFGAIAICRELARRSPRQARIVWPEDATDALTSNAQELVLHAMSTEVTLVMSKVAGQSGGYLDKARTSLTGVLDWLEAHAPSALARLPEDRDLSLLEVTLFCLVRHLGFREVLDTTPYRRLGELTERFGRRPSALATEYRLD